MTEVRRVLCVAGSLRRRSANRAALEAAIALAQPPLLLTLWDGLAGLPPFNPDDEIDPLPSTVIGWRHAVAVADGLLIACPEYAHGVPGAFKNALDWLVGDAAFPGKPVVLVNGSARGSYHAQEALAEILRTMSATLLVPAPLAVALPGRGASVGEVLGDPARRTELEAVLALLARI